MLTINAAPAQADLKISESTACLLCFERDCRHCHRTIVADHIIAKTGMKRQNLGVQHGLARSHDHHRLHVPYLEAPL